MRTDSIYLILLYLTTLLLILYFRQNDWIILAVLFIAFVIAIILFKPNVLVVMILATLFSIIEIICVHYKLWSYNRTKKYIAPFVPNVPMWLYFAWALSIIFIIKMLETLKRNKLFS
jgi:hypothetical protein